VLTGLKIFACAAAELEIYDYYNYVLNTYVN